MSKILGYDEASKFLGVPANTLRYWRQLGKGPRSARISKRVAFREEDLQAWLDAQFADGPSAA